MGPGDNEFDTPALQGSILFFLPRPLQSRGRRVALISQVQTTLSRPFSSRAGGENKGQPHSTYPRRGSTLLSPTLPLTAGRELH